MKTRDEEIVEQLAELCKVNECVNFEISVPALRDAGSAFLCFENRSYSLEELRLTLRDIERLEGLEKLFVTRKFRINELSQNEIARTCYSLFVPSKPEMEHSFSPIKMWKPVTFVALLGGATMCIAAIVMFSTHTALVGYDTHYGGGYGYHALYPEGMLLIGLGVLVFGLTMVPWKRRR